MSRSLTLEAFAKINWLLKILGKRSDGFHELRTILQTVDLADILRIEVAAGEGISLETRGRRLPEGPENLVWTAAELFLSRGGFRQRVHLSLQKSIPVGAGLGGGSSDAAAVLLGLNSLLENPFSLSQLSEMAARIGSDVPFFLAGGTVLAQGRGERLELLEDVRPTRLLLHYPEFPITAREAYGLGEWPPLEPQGKLTMEEVNNRIQRFRRRIEQGLPVADLAENDFDDPLFENYPEMSRARALLSRMGCQHFLVCGSGSTLLGIPSPGQFQKVHDKLLDLGEGTLLAVQTLSRHDYRRRLGAAGVKWGT